MGSFSVKTFRPYDYPENWKILQRKKKIHNIIERINDNKRIKNKQNIKNYYIRIKI
jgi:hypothetical protein